MSTRLLILTHHLFVNTLILSAITIFLGSTVFAAEDRKNDGHYLIVGSTRMQGRLPFWHKKVMGLSTESSDKLSDNDPFSHQYTFNGQAVSVDILDSSRKDLPHLKVDVRKFKPEKLIRQVYMELFPSVPSIPSIPMLAERLAGSNGDKFNPEWYGYMPDAIRNLARKMRQDALLEIEHLPYLTILDVNLYCAFAAELRTLNPFNGFFSPMILEYFWMERQVLQRYKGNRAMQSQFLNGKIAQWTSKYGYEPALITRILREMLGHADFFRKAFNGLISILGSQVNLQVDEDYEKYQKDPWAYLGDGDSITSLSYLVISDFTVIMQQELIVKFLEENGFKNVNIQRTDSPYNGRRNIWLISAKRNNHPI